MWSPPQMCRKILRDLRPAESRPLNIDRDLGQMPPSARPTSDLPPWWNAICVPRIGRRFPSSAGGRRLRLAASPHLRRAHGAGCARSGIPAYAFSSPSRPHLPRRPPRRWCTSGGHRVPRFPRLALVHPRVCFLPRVRICSPPPKLPEHDFQFQLWGGGGLTLKLACTPSPSRQRPGGPAKAAVISWRPRAAVGRLTNGPSSLQK